MSLMNLLAMPVSVWPTDPASCFIELRSCLAWKMEGWAHVEWGVEGGVWREGAHVEWGVEGGV